jgi:acyl-CoA dehydrogenase
MAIDFSLSPELEDIRLQIRTFVDDVIKPEEERLDGKGDVYGDAEPLAGRERIEALIGLRKKAFEAGIWLPHMPEEWGGMGLGHVELAMVQAEAAKSTVRHPTKATCTRCSTGRQTSRKRSISSLSVMARRHHALP